MAIETTTAMNVLDWLARAFDVQSIQELIGDACPRFRLTERFILGPKSVSFYAESAGHATTSN